MISLYWIPYGESSVFQQPVRRESVDVVISDVLMPNKDGYELCYELRKDEKLKALPFIFYTNTYTSASSEKLAYEFGADGFIKKPAAAETIVESVREVMASRTKTGSGSTMRSYPGELQLTAQYCTGLISKLEDQNLDLEATRERLLKINHQLLERTKALEKAKEDLRQANDGLERRVRVRTQELEMANQELEAFSYAASHDLHAPLRAIGGFVEFLERRNSEKLDTESRRFIGTIRGSVEKMSNIIDSLLELSRASRKRIGLGSVDLSALARSVTEDLRKLQPERNATVLIAENLIGHGDENLLRIALNNLIGNAWKYTGKNERPVIEFGTVKLADHPAPVFFVRDNGAGFDMQHAKKLFQAFERLHTEQEFSGSGIGLATVQRIIQRHGGQVWAKSQPSRGAVFYFTLPIPPTEPPANTEAYFQNERTEQQ